MDTFIKHCNSCNALTTHTRVDNLELCNDCVVRAVMRDRNIDWGQEEPEAVAHEGAD